MRIGLVTGEYPPQQGGVGDFTRALAGVLAERGDDVVVFTQDTVPADSVSGIRVEPIIRRWDMRAAAAIARVAVRHRLEVVNLQYQAAAYGMGLPVHVAILQWRMARQPFASVVTYHDLRVPYLFPKAGPLRWQAVRALGRFAHGIIATNAQDARRLHTALPGHPVAIVPIGSNIRPELPAGYQRETWRARYGIAAGDLLVGYFGFLNASKGGDTLVAAFEQLVAAGHPAHLLFVGGEHGASDPTNQAYASGLRARIAAAGLEGRVHRTGFVSGPEVSAALAAVDVMALPYQDGASPRRGSLMAALVHGCAIVTTEPAEEFPADAMMYVRAGDAGALATAIGALANDPQRRAVLGQQVTALATAFAWKPIAEQTAVVYTHAIARQRGL